MILQGKLTTGQNQGRLSPCVCNTLRMVTRVVTQLYDDCLRPSGLRVTQFSILAAIARLAGHGKTPVKESHRRFSSERASMAGAAPRPRWRP